MTTRTPVAQEETVAERRHGEPATYDWWGCRCPECREAHRLYRKRLRENRQPPGIVPAVGTVRRIRALVAAGYPQKDLAARMNISPQRVRQLNIDLGGMVHRVTAEKVRCLFAELAAVPGPSKYARTVAEKYGWMPPHAWDEIDDPAAEPDLGAADDGWVDEVAVERVLAGEHIELTDSELIAALQLGTARGESLSRLSLLLGINYAGAKTLLGGELTPRRAKRAERTGRAS
jgi:hypothetical protein